jgi:hypothetical protein
MNKIKNYEEFLYEWKMFKHWKERAELSSPISRTIHVSDYARDGWECNEFIQVSEDAKPVGGKKLDMKGFLMKSKMEEKEFIDKLQQSLQALAFCERAQSYNFPEGTHRYVRMGRIAFQVGEEFFSPVLTTTYGSGDIVWADIKDNVGATILYLPYNYERDDLFRKAFQHKLKGMENLPNEKYKMYFKIEELFPESYMTVIPESTDWKSLVKSQVDTGKKFKMKKDVEYKIDQKWEDWSKLLTPDAVTTFDAGTKIYSGNAVKTVKTINAKPPMIEAFLAEGGVKFVKIGSTLDVIVGEGKDLKIREIGNLPSEGVLVKTVKIESFRKVTSSTGKTKNGIAGPIIDYYVAMPDGTKAYTDIKRS